MYRKLNYIFVGVLMLNFISCGQQNNKENKMAIKMLKEFYTDYIKKVLNYETGEDLIQKISTENLQQQLDDPDISWNILVYGQFCEKNWIDNMSIYADSVGTNNFIVVFSYERSDYDKKCKFVAHKKIKLHLIKIGNDYKIDKVLTGAYYEVFPEDDVNKIEPISYHVYK